jgi:hypothetical protein
VSGSEEEVVKLVTKVRIAMASLGEHERGSEDDTSDEKTRTSGGLRPDEVTSL